MAIVASVVVAIACIIIGALFGFKVLKVKTKSVPIESVSRADNQLTNDPSTKVETTVVAQEQPPSFVAPTVVASPTPTVIQKTVADIQNLYVDRGCWLDGGFQYGQSDNWDRNAKYNRALGIDNATIVNITTSQPQLRTENEIFNFALQTAKNGNYDTFAFTKAIDGSNSVELRFGTYHTEITPSQDGIFLKYDKFGPATGVCNFFGDIYINHVFSMIEPYTTTSSFKNYQYQDRGCWNDRIDDRAISKTWIDMRQTGIPRSEWYNWAVQKASAGSYDTFAFQNDSALFLGNFTFTAFRYNKFGRAVSSAPCLEFGAYLVNRVYSNLPFAPN